MALFFFFINSSIAQSTLLNMKVYLMSHFQNNYNILIMSFENIKKQQYFFNIKNIPFQTLIYFYPMP